MLLPASLQDWLPKGQLSYFISDTVDALDLKAFFDRDAKGGARDQPFRAAVMVKLLVYGHAIGVIDALLERAKRTDESEADEPQAKAQDNFTDPDSRIMKRTGGGFDASYNAQTAVDDTAPAAAQFEAAAPQKLSPPKTQK